MSEEYRLIKYNENLAEIGNDRSIGLLFLVDEDCERKLRIIVDLLNEQQTTISALKEENEQLQKVCSHLKKENKSLIENIFDIYEKVKWVSK